MKNGNEPGILFIGNSHTYYNDLPLLVRQQAEGQGCRCRVTMLAHGGWTLTRHFGEPQTRFNILYGNYDYIVLQEHAHPFGPEDEFLEAVRELSRLIRSVGSVPVIYECWARQNEPEAQEHMNAVHRQAAGEAGALLAPVGEKWWDFMRSHPTVSMYAPDGAHASPAGSHFAAACIWDTIHDHIRQGGQDG